MTRDPSFSAWLAQAKPGDTYTIPHHPSEAERVQGDVRTYSARYFVTTSSEATAEGTRVCVLTVNATVSQSPEARARSIFETHGLELAKHPLSVAHRPGDREPLVRALQQLYFRLGYNVVDSSPPKSKRGLFYLSLAPRFANATPAPAVEPLLETPGQLEAKGVLRLDSRTLDAARNET